MKKRRPSLKKKSTTATKTTNKKSGNMSQPTRILFVVLLSLVCSNQLSSASVTSLLGKRRPLPQSLRGLPLPPTYGGDLGGSARDEFPAIPDSSEVPVEREESERLSALRQASEGEGAESQDSDEGTDLYSFSNFYYNLVDYADGVVSEANASLTAELAEVKDKVSHVV